MLCAGLVFAGASARAQPSQPLPPGVIYPGEYNNYLSAINTPDLTARAQAIEIWLTWYPYSVLRAGAFEAAMAAWQSAGNPAKADAVAMRLLQSDPDNVRALANRAYSGRARAMAGEEAALAPAVTAAQRGVLAMSKWQKPASLSEAEFSTVKLQVLAVFDGTLGYAALQAKDYLHARKHFLAAVSVEPDNLQDCYQLSVALLEGQPPDPQGFWYALRAASLARAAKNGVAGESIEKYTRSWYLHYHGSDEGWDRLVSRVASGDKRPPNDLSSTITRALTASEAAVQMANVVNLSALSFGEWEFVLAHRDDSPDNQAAAEKVWKAIGEKQRGGARLKLPVKVIAASPERLEAALAEQNQSSNTADIEIAMAHELRPMPAAGTTISIIGVLSDYRPKPFLFFLTRAELAEESMPVAGGACATPRPQMCTRDYRPACGVRQDGSRRTYGNACSACADPEIVSQAAGACP